MNKLSLVLLTSGIANAGYVAMNNYETGGCNTASFGSLNELSTYAECVDAATENGWQLPVQNTTADLAAFCAGEWVGGVFAIYWNPNVATFANGCDPCACKQPPTSAPTAAPSTVAPSKSPTVSPTASPVTSSPSKSPTMAPTSSPTSGQVITGTYTFTSVACGTRTTLEDAARSAIISNVGISVNQLSTSSSCGSVILTFSISDFAGDPSQLQNDVLNSPSTILGSTFVTNYGTPSTEVTATTATDDDEVQDGSAAVYIVAGVMGFLVIALLVVSFFYFRSRSKTGGDKLFLPRSSTRRALDSTPSRRVSSVGAKSPKLMRRGSAVMRSDRVKAMLEAAESKTSNEGGVTVAVEEVGAEETV